MFKKGDYIVNLWKVLDEDGNFPSGYCYKQNIDHKYLQANDYTNYPNGIAGVEFEQSDRWRYAKPHEIEIYDLAKRPIDTRQLVTHGDKVEAISNVENNEKSYTIEKGTELIVEDTIRTSRKNGNKTWIYFEGIPGLFNKKEFIRCELKKEMK